MQLLLSRWLLIFFAIVFISTADASFTASVFTALTRQRTFMQYYAIVSNYFGVDVLNILTSAKMIEDANCEMHPENVIEETHNWSIGDVLIDQEFEIFFFIGKCKNDKTKATLMKASSSICLNLPISEFTLVKKHDRSMISSIDYSNDPIIEDSFKILEEFSEYALIKSVKNSIIFVAPRYGLENFLKGEYQKKINARLGPKEKINLPKTVGANISDSFPFESTLPLHLPQLNAISNNPNIEDDNLMSPDSVIYGNHLREQPKSPIENLFNLSEGSFHDRFKFIYEHLVPMLINSELALNDAMVFVETVDKILKEEMNVNCIQVTGDENITVVGDIHGQFKDLLRIFKNNGWPSEHKKYLFNGDIVDRGEKSIECLLLIYALKITFPYSVFINRGNHESLNCGNGTFYFQCKKFDKSETFFKTCHKGFISLPLAHIINNQYYVVHAGIREGEIISNINLQNRFNPNDQMESFIRSSLWDDSSEINGIRPNPERGSNCHYFGPDIINSFLETNNLKLIIRSHTFVSRGIHFSNDNKCWTLFSAPNYGGQKNPAAVINFNSSLKCNIGILSPKLNDSPVAY